MQSRARWSGLVAALTITLASPLALAQKKPETLPSETVKQKPVTKGTTDLTKNTFATSSQPEDDDPSYLNSVTLGAGGLFSSGNARAVALTSVLRTRFRRDEHQFSGASAINYGRAGALGEEIQTTVENYQGVLRYDYFLSNAVSLFLQSTARRDKFQGLDLRLNIDPGVAYYFINTKTHRLQVEGGYDLQYDIRRTQDVVQEPPDDAPPGTPPPPPLDRTRALHNLRLFLGYENKLREEVHFLSSVEYLQNYGDIETFRLIINAGLESTIADRLALATTITMRYENKPLPNIAKLDSIASFNLVYTLF